MTRSQSAAARSLKKRFGTLVPAQLTRMSMRPCRARIAAEARTTACLSLVSTASASPLPPACLISASVSASAVARRPETTTVAPALASSTAAPWPMPLPPPVTQAIFPLNVPIRSKEKTVRSCDGLGGFQNRRDRRIERCANRAQQLPFRQREFIIGHRRCDAGLDKQRFFQRCEQVQLVESAFHHRELQLGRWIQHAAKRAESSHSLAERIRPALARVRKQRQHDFHIRGDAGEALVFYRRRALLGLPEVAPAQGLQHELGERYLVVGLDQGLNRPEEFFALGPRQRLESRNRELEQRQAQLCSERRQHVGETCAASGELLAAFPADNRQLTLAYFALPEKERKKSRAGAVLALHRGAYLRRNGVEDAACVIDVSVGRIADACHHGLRHYGRASADGRSGRSAPERIQRARQLGYDRALLRRESRRLGALGAFVQEPLRPGPQQPLDALVERRMGVKQGKLEVIVVGRVDAHMR